MAMNMSYCRHENTAKALQECLTYGFQAHNVRDGEHAEWLYNLCLKVVNTLDIETIKAYNDDLLLEELGE